MGSNLLTKMTKMTKMFRGSSNGGNRGMSYDSSRKISTRKLHMEGLEERALLSVTTFDNSATMELALIGTMSSETETVAVAPNQVSGTNNKILGVYLTFSKESMSNVSEVNELSSIESVNVGDMFYTQVWVYNEDSSATEGITGGYVDLNYSAENFTFVTVNGGSEYPLFYDYYDGSNDGLVATLGGSASPGNVRLGTNGAYCLLSEVAFTADVAGNTNFSVTVPTLDGEPMPEIGLSRTDEYPVSYEHAIYGTASLTVVGEEPAYDTEKVGVFITLSNESRANIAEVTELSSIDHANVGDTVYAQIWVKNIDGNTTYGITGGNLDMTYSANNFTFVTVNAGSEFPLFQDWYDGYTDGLVATLGGMANPGNYQYGTNGAYCLLSEVVFTADTFGETIFSVSTPSMDGEIMPEIGLNRQDEVPLLQEHINYGTASLTVVGEEPVYDSEKVGVFITLSNESRANLSEVTELSTIENINVGDMVYAQIWVKNIDGNTTDGITGGYVDMTYPSNNFTFITVNNGPNFTLFADYATGSNGRVSTIGGTANPGDTSFGTTDSYNLLSEVVFRADKVGDTSFSIVTPSLGGEILPEIGLNRQDEVPLLPEHIDYGTASLTVVGEGPVHNDKLVGVYITLSNESRVNTAEVTELSSIDHANVGDTVYAQIWVKNIDGNTTDGITGGYLDMNYSANNFTFVTVNAGSDYPLFQDFFDGSIDGLVATIGGNANPGNVWFGTNDAYCLLSEVAFTADTVGETIFSVSTPSMDGDIMPEIGLNRQDEVPLLQEHIDYGTATLSIVNSVIEGVTVEGWKGTYNGQKHSITVNGTLAGDTVAYIYNGHTYSKLPEFTDVGNYSVTVKVSRQGYQDWSDTAEVVIGKKTLAVSGTKVVSREYDGTTDATVNIGSLIGVCSGDRITLTGTTEFPSPEVGDYQLTVHYTISGDDVANYYTPTNQIVQASILAPAPKVSVRVVLTDSLPTISESAELPESLESVGVNSTVYANVWVYNADGNTVEGITGGCVDLAYSADNFTVGNVTPGPDFNLLPSYDKSVAGLVATLGGNAQLGVLDLGTDGNWLLLTSVAFTATCEGETTFTVQTPSFEGEVTQAVAINRTDEAPLSPYHIDYGTPVNVSVVRPLIEGVTLDGWSGVYDGEEHSVTLDGTLAGDTVTYTYNGQTYSALPTFTDAGNYSVSVKISRKGYQDWNGSADVQISRKQLTVTGTTVSSREYDETTDARVNVGRLIGVATGDNVKLTATAEFPSPEVGDYQLTVRYAISGTKVANYIAPVNQTVQASILPPSPKVSVRVVLTDSLPTISTSAELPESLESTGVTSTVYASVWLYNADGSTSAGITGGCVDLTYSAANYTVGNVTPGSDFNLLPSSDTSVAGLVATLGGNAQLGVLDLGTDGSWVLLTTVAFTATNEGETTFTVQSPTFEGEEMPEIGINRTDEAPLKNYHLDYGTATLNVISQPLDTPSTPTVASYGANRHSVTWNAVENATGYRVAYSTDQVNWTILSSSETTLVVTGLTYGDQVHYKVMAVGDNVRYSNSDWSASKSLYVCPMDVNGDKLISGADLTYLSTAYLSRPGRTNWDPRADIDGNNLVSGSDLTWISKNWLKRATSADLSYPAEKAQIFADADFDALDVDCDFALDADVDPIFDEIF